MRNLFISLVLSIILCTFTTARASQWQVLEKHSTLGFTSIKQSAIAENHVFKEFHGHVNADGQFNINIKLSSVETYIPIRNTRMLDFLFETSKFPEAKLSGSLDTKLLSVQSLGIPKMADVPAKLSLHGVEQSVNLSVSIVAIDNGTLAVSSTKPVLISTGAFGLKTGLQKLKDIAKLSSIASTVPVYFTVILKQSPKS